MQDVRKICFIDEFLDKIEIMLLNDNYQIQQYKTYNYNNSKLNNVYCGIIEKIDYSIESIFVRLEDNLVGFLSFKHLTCDYYDKVHNTILKNLKKSSKIIVQVIRDNIEGKLVKLTQNIALSNQFCTYFPYKKGAHGISSNIKAENRVFYKEFIKNLKIEGSVIIRTSANEIKSEDVEKDLRNLIDLSAKIRKKFKRSYKHNLLFQYDELIHVLQAYSAVLIKIVYVKNEALHKKLTKYHQDREINFPEIIIKKDFEFLDTLEKQIEGLYEFKIDLPSGGSILIEKTEAMITIDVNSAKGINESSMEKTSFSINSEAAQVIIEQIILRNLGGIIAIDLIDMKDPDNLKSVHELFKKGFKNDTASVKILPINELCVLNISRERKGLSLLDKNFTKCKNCMKSFVKKPEFLVFQFLNNLSKYNLMDTLKIELKQSLFNELFSQHYSFINRYRNLKWQICEAEEFKISRNEKR